MRRSARFRLDYGFPSPVPRGCLASISLQIVPCIVVVGKLPSKLCDLALLARSCSIVSASCRVCARGVPNASLTKGMLVNIGWGDVRLVNYKYECESMDKLVCFNVLSQYAVHPEKQL